MGANIVHEHCAPPPAGLRARRWSTHFCNKLYLYVFPVWPNVIVSCSCGQLVNPASQPFENWPFRAACRKVPGGSAGACQRCAARHAPRPHAG